VVLNLGEGQYDKAVEFSEKAITLNPNISFSYMVLGVIYTYNGKPDEATSMFTKSERLVPNNPLPIYI